MNYNNKTIFTNRVRKRDQLTTPAGGADTHYDLYSSFDDKRCRLRDMAISCFLVLAYSTVKKNVEDKRFV